LVGGWKPVNDGLRCISDNENVDSVTTVEPAVEPAGMRSPLPPRSKHSDSSMGFTVHVFSSFAGMWCMHAWLEYSPKYCAANKLPSVC
jgi:hypothetical protein